MQGYGDLVAKSFVVEEIDRDKVGGVLEPCAEGDGTALETGEEAVRRESEVFRQRE